MTKKIVVYRTTQARLLAGERAKCQLCCLLVDLGAANGSKAEVDFQVDQDLDNPVDDPADAQYLLVHVRDTFMTYCLYTPAGVSGRSLLQVTCSSTQRTLQKT